MIGLSDKIESFWTSRPHERVAGMANSLWAFDGRGVSVSGRTVPFVSDLLGQL